MESQTIRIPNDNNPKRMSTNDGIGRIGIGMRIRKLEQVRCGPSWEQIKYIAGNWNEYELKRKLGLGFKECQDDKIGSWSNWKDRVLKRCFMGTNVLEREKVKYRSLEQGYSYNKIRVYITMENK